MKVERKEIIESPSFKPFNIEITIESKEEAQALYAIFNYSPNADLFRYRYSLCDDIKCAIGSDYYVGGYREVISNGITYKDFYIPKKVK